MPVTAVGEGSVADGTDSATGDGGEPKDPVEELFTLVRQGSFDEALRRLQADPQHWCAKDVDGHTLLHWAALAGNEAFVSAALASGVQVDAAASNGQTAFMWAMIKGTLGSAKLLLDARADPLVKDSMGASPLILTVQHQQHSAFLLLMATDMREKQLKTADGNGCGVVHWAAYKGDLTSLKLLEYFDANFATLDDMKMTPLHRAVQASQAGVCEFLLDRQIDPSHTDNQGRTCMDIAIGNHDTAMKRSLDRLLEVSCSVGSVTLAGEGEAHDAENPKIGAGLRRRDKRKDEAEKLKKKAAANAAATFWLVSVSLALFQYLTDLRIVSYTIAPTASLLFELGVAISVSLFFFVAMSDPGKVPARVKGCSGVEDLVKAISAGDPHDFSRLCTTSWVLKGLRTKYCTHTGACVDEFDHFCGWLNVAIGRGNHRPFILLACVEASTQFVDLYLCWVCAKHLVDAPTTYEWLLGISTQYPLLAFVALLQSFTAPGIAMLAMSQLRLIAINLTTNEMINVGRYKHFWDESDNAIGQKKRAFRNPFHKGGIFANCLDFWWRRRRGDSGPGRSAA